MMSVSVVAPMGSHIWTLGLQLAGLFGEAMKLLEGAALLEKARHWEGIFRVYSFILLLGLS